jgi:hypothetical protein
MIELVCAVVFSVGIVRDVPRGELRAVSHEAMGIAWYPAPYVVFPCIMTDREAYHFYSRHDPQMWGDYDPQRGMVGQ